MLPERTAMNRQEVFIWCQKQYGTQPDYPWNDDDAVLRHSGTGKWYAVLIHVSRKRLGLAGEGMADVMNLKCDPLLIGSLRMQPGYLAAYHMNKDRWISVLLGGPARDEDITALIDMSFRLTGPKKGRAKAK